MVTIQRIHEENGLPSTLKGHELDLWRLTHCRAYQALAAKSCFPDYYPDRPAPPILVLAADATLLGRTLAHRLSLDVPLTECLLLARFLGYPAGGDFAVRLLSKSMEKQGGFSLTEQSLRIVDELEMVFPEFNGLNLSWEIRHALGAMPNALLRAHRETAADRAELGVAALATRLSIIQIHLLYLPAEQREATLEVCPLWKNTQAALSATYPRLEYGRLFTYTLQEFLLRLIDEASLVTGRSSTTLSPSTDRSLQDLELRLHHDRAAALAQAPAAQMLEQIILTLLPWLVNHPHAIPEKLGLRVKKDGIHRVACDYLASLSDAQLHSLHQQEIAPAMATVKRTQMDLL